MKISRPERNLARLLVEDLVNRDSRLKMTDDTVEYVLPNHDAIDLFETGFVILDLETTGAKAPPCRVTEIGAFKVQSGQVVGSFQTLLDPEMPILKSLPASRINKKWSPVRAISRYPPTYSFHRDSVK